MFENNFSLNQLTDLYSSKLGVLRNKMEVKIKSSKSLKALPGIIVGHSIYTRI